GMAVLVNRDRIGTRAELSQEDDARLIALSIVQGHCFSIEKGNMVRGLQRESRLDLIRTIAEARGQRQKGYLQHGAEDRRRRNGRFHDRGSLSGAISEEIAFTDRDVK